MQHYSNTPYATMAALLWAREAVAKQQYDDAFLKLQWAYQNSQVPAFRQIARLRAARVLLAQKQYQKALKVLKTVEDKTYLPVIENIKGDIFVAEGNDKAARAAYQQAKVGFTALGAMDPLLQIKLNSPL
jgi:predicted negative regulator of RcsB-dependent stress response